MLGWKTLWFTAVYPGTVAVYVPWLLVRSDVGRFRLDLDVVRVMGFVAIALGAAGYLACAVDFVRCGRGTPAPWDPPRVLVAAGPYRYSRNPMYVSIVLALLGEVLACGSLALVVYTFVVFCAFRWRVLHHEERVLARDFGDEFLRYCARVPRWLGRATRSTHRT